MDPWDYQKQIEEWVVLSNDVFFKLSNAVFKFDGVYGNVFWICTIAFVGAKFALGNAKNEFSNF